MATVRVSKRAAKAAAASVDWAKVDAMSDDDIARQTAANPDSAPDITLSRAKLLFRVGSKRLKTRFKIRLVRHALGMSQAEFAKSYRFSLRTLQNWEQGTREPGKTIETLIKLIAYEPERVKRILAA